jgi:hypothetical protein
MMIQQIRKEFSDLTKIRPVSQQAVCIFTDMHFADSLRAFTNTTPVPQHFHYIFLDKYNFQASIIAILYYSHSS